MRRGHFDRTLKTNGADGIAASRWQAGATAIEYGLIAAFVALAIYVGALVAGNGVNGIFVAMADQIKRSLE